MHLKQSVSGQYIKRTTEEEEKKTVLHFWTLNNNNNNRTSVQKRHTHGLHTIAVRNSSLRVDSKYNTITTKINTFADLHPVCDWTLPRNDSIMNGLSFWGLMFAFSIWQMPNDRLSYMLCWALYNRAYTDEWMGNNDAYMRRIARTHTYVYLSVLPRSSQLKYILVEGTEKMAYGGTLSLAVGYIAYIGWIK